MEMGSLRGAPGVTKWEGENNESVYESCSMGTSANGVKSGDWSGGMGEKKKTEVAWPY